LSVTSTSLAAASDSLVSTCLLLELASLLSAALSGLSEASSCLSGVLSGLSSEST
jgi:hypothetical protein